MGWKGLFLLTDRRIVLGSGTVHDCNYYIRSYGQRDACIVYVYYSSS